LCLFLSIRKVVILVGALAKIGSFGFAEGSACGWGKTKCAICAVALKFKIFCAVGKKLKHRRVGNECRLTRCPFVVSFVCLCSPVKMVYFFLVFSRLFVVVGSSFTLAANSQIYESFTVASVLLGFFYAPMRLLLVVLPGESGHWQVLGTGWRVISGLT
jgi:hypothetical protein